MAWVPMTAKDRLFRAWADANPPSALSPTDGQAWGAKAGILHPVVRDQWAIRGLAGTS